MGIPQEFRHLIWKIHLKQFGTYLVHAQRLQKNLIIIWLIMPCPMVKYEILAHVCLNVFIAWSFYIWIVLVNSTKFFLIFRKCRKSSEITIRPSCNCFEWHIVMQYCPVANYHYVHNLCHGKVMFWLFPENGGISERTVNRALTVHTTL